ncbi:hypothetical protein RHMOL_Rhmol12G0110300 [Rhododendron molle]|uniref:Uncharacterized protein n=1 Tax=Rhododendron molle TaxID=49168 RepID=A0ACC0LIC1_RHOML|nr:hypothetical protein RHMOL_Rhmol12G0110300 [Rhododendron molle]
MTKSAWRKISAPACYSAVYQNTYMMRTTCHMNIQIWIQRIEIFISCYQNMYRCVLNADKLKQLLPMAAMVKFNINITDPTATIDAVVFPEVAEQIYGITANNITIDTPDSLSPELLDKLAEPKKCSITLKAYMYNYAGIAQCRFNVHSMTDKTALEALQSSHQHLSLPPTIPDNKEKLGASSPSDKTTEGNASKKPKLN